MEKEGSGRSKRVKADKTGRFAAIEKLKLLKGSKNKYEVIDEAPVYEEVNEKDFSKIVQQRQEDDWIVDDDGSGYVEDGREIFDDDEDAAAAYTSKKTSQAVKKKSLVPEKKSVNGRMGNIKNMFQAQPVKRKNESDIKLDEDDDLLGNILESVHNNSSPLTCLPKPMLLQKKSKRSLGPLLPASPLTRPANNPFAVKPSHSVGGKDCFPLRKPLQPKIVNFDVADTMLDRQIDKNLEAIKNEEEKVDAASFDLKMETEMLAEMDTFDDFSASNDLFATENFSQATVPEEKIEPMACSEELFEDSGFIESVFNPAPEIKTHPIDIVIDPKSLPLTVLESGESVLRFFWFDAFEDSFKHPGVVYLFGKIYIQASQSYVSCCVIIKDIPRRIYVLPRETKMNVATKADTGKPITMTDVYLEINSITEKMKISEFKTKKTKKKYAFDNTDIPDECEYLEMQYSATFPALPSDMSGSTFSHVLGTDTSSLEILLLEQKLKGPCWIDVHVPQLSCPPVSWCKIEAVVHNYQHIVPVDKTLPIPPLVVFSMNIITNVNSKTQQNEIAAISCVSHNDFPLDKVAPKPHYNVHFCALSKPSDCIFPYDLKTVLLSNKNMNIENLDSERALLAYFLAKLHKADPDVIIGHDILGFGLDVLLHRVAFHKIPNWSRVGRLKRSGAPRFSNFSHGSSFEKNVTCGRLLCDIKISAKELLRLPSYELTELAGNILQLKYQEISAENLRDCYSTSTKLMQLVNNTMTAADIILRINCELNILPLALQITNIAGCVMSRTLLGGRSERNEFLLLHAFHEKNYIYPAKVSGKKGAKPTFENRDDATGALAETKPGRRKPAYEGGLVLDPKIGFYDKYILLMDFNSLYPSIIQEYNICFTTIDRVPNMDKKTEDELFIKLQEVVSDPGVLPTEIRKLVDSRKQVKNMMKAPDVSKDRLVQFDIRQRALKLTANSMYGCLGFTHSRFYAKFLAALITRKGREVLMQTKELVEKMGLDVIYGDTDSIMINTNQIDIDDVFQLGNKVKVEINKLYRLLEIDIDGVYKSMLLLKKKKYAALAVSRLPNGQIVTKEEMKGLDIVRRDWSQLAKTAGEFVIKQILSSKPKEDVLEIIHAHLIALGEDVLSGKRPISDFIIMKQLNKNPEDYPDMKSLPHVTVALRLNAKGGKKIRQHDTVPYIVCKDGTDLPNTQRAYHPEELKSDEKLSIDFEYYLANQVHPVISRLCAPIDGTDAAIIAKLLGLNPSKYVASIRQEEQYEDKSLPSSSFDDEERFKSCDKLIFQCPAKDCSEKITVDVVLKVETQPWQLALTTCPKCNANFEDFPAALCNQLQKITRPYIFTYYKKILVCEDVGCAYQTRKIPLIFSNGGPVCPLCRKANLLAQYTESQLYTQLAYFSYLFDIDKCLKKLGNDSGKVTSDLYSQLKKTADKTLKSSSYGEVNLSILFHGLFIKPSTTI